MNPPVAKKLRQLIKEDDYTPLLLAFAQEAILKDARLVIAAEAQDPERFRESFKRSIVASDLWLACAKKANELLTTPETP